MSFVRLHPWVDPHVFGSDAGDLSACATIRRAAEVLGPEYVSNRAYDFTRFRGSSWLVQLEFAGEMEREAIATVHAQDMQREANRRAALRRARRERAAALLLLDDD
jgi:hypothetical protein